MHWYLEVLKKYAVLDGRARRKEYWMFVLVNFVITVALSLISPLIGVGARGGWGLLAVIYTLAMIIPSITVHVRRLHDIDRSGWWMWISLIPLVGVLVLLLYAVREGTPGSNQYGPNPKGA